MVHIEDDMQLTKSANVLYFNGQLAVAEIAFRKAVVDGEIYNGAFSAEPPLPVIYRKNGPLAITKMDKERLGLNEMDLAFAANVAGYIVYKFNVLWFKIGEERQFEETWERMKAARDEAHGYPQPGYGFGLNQISR